MSLNELTVMNLLSTPSRYLNVHRNNALIQAQINLNKLSHEPPTLHFLWKMVQAHME